MRRQPSFMPKRCSSLSIPVPICPPFPTIKHHRQLAEPQRAPAMQLRARVKELSMREYNLQICPCGGMVAVRAQLVLNGL